MIHLTVKNKNVEVSLWEEKLLDLSVSYKIEINAAIQEAELKHGREHHIGNQAISNYLIDLEKFVYNWRRCACEG